MKVYIQNYNIIFNIGYIYERMLCLSFTCIKMGKYIWKTVKKEVKLMI